MFDDDFDIFGDAIVNASSEEDVEEVEEVEEDAEDGVEASELQARQIQRKRGPRKKRRQTRRPTSKEKASRRKYERSSQGKKTRNTYKPRKRAAEEPMSDLLKKTIRLASVNKDLRPYLLPIIKSEMGND